MPPLILEFMTKNKKRIEAPGSRKPQPIYLKRKTMQEKIDAYFEGYRRIPDGDDPDFIALEKASLEDSPYADEDWPEAPEDDSPAN